MSDKTNLMEEDLSQMSTSMPLIEPGIYDMVIKSAEMKPTKKGDPQLVLELRNVSPVQSKDGDTLQGGSAVVFHRTMTKPVGKSTQQMVNRGVATIVQAAKLGPLTAYGTGATAQVNAIDQWHKQLEGKIVRCRVRVEAARTNSETGEQYDETNSVKEFIAN